MRRHKLIGCYRTAVGLVQRATIGRGYERRERIELQTVAQERQRRPVGRRGWRTPTATQTVRYGLRGQAKQAPRYMPEQEGCRCNSPLASFVVERAANTSPTTVQNVRVDHRGFDIGVPR
jgi:hypothetical protein